MLPTLKSARLIYPLEHLSSLHRRTQFRHTIAGPDEIKGVSNAFTDFFVNYYSPTQDLEASHSKQAYGYRNSVGREP